MPFGVPVSFLKPCATDAGPPKASISTWQTGPPEMRMPPLLNLASILHVMNKSIQNSGKKPRGAVQSGLPPPQSIRDSVIRLAGDSQDGIQSVGAMLARLAGRSEME